MQQEPKHQIWRALPLHHDLQSLQGLSPPACDQGIPWSRTHGPAKWGPCFQPVSNQYCQHLRTSWRNHFKTPHHSMQVSRCLKKQLKPFAVQILQDFIGAKTFRSHLGATKAHSSWPAKCQDLSLHYCAVADRIGRTPWLW